MAMGQKQTYEASDLEDLPTLCVGQCCSLKIEERNKRVWLCRVAGGVTIETYNGTRWEITAGRCTAPSATDEVTS